MRRSGAFERIAITSATRGCNSCNRVRPGDMMTTGIGSSRRFCWYAKPLSTVTRASDPPSAASSHCCRCRRLGPSHPPVTDNRSACRAPSTRPNRVVASELRGSRRAEIVLPAVLSASRPSRRIGAESLASVGPRRSLCEIVGGAAGLGLPPGRRSPVAPPLMPNVASPSRRSMQFSHHLGLHPSPRCHPSAAGWRCRGRHRRP